jgi:predicted RNA-binding Zn-ribbon protein involved in translation (DUF1610 family)
MEYDKSKVLYACPDCGETTTPKTFEREPIKCSCGRVANVRKCPSCGEIIPKIALETPNLPFSIVGGNNSGKTTFTTIMLHELGMSSILLGLAMKPQTKETVDIQNEHYKRIYENHRCLECTLNETNPQIWEIMNLRKKRGINIPAYSMVLYDDCGDFWKIVSEEYENYEFDRYLNRKIAVSKGIVLMIDPSTIEKSTTDFINSVAQYIRSIRNIKPSRKIDTSVAIVFSKFDTVLSSDFLAPNAAVRNNTIPIKNGKLNMEDINRISLEINNWLIERGAISLSETLNSQFKDFSLFGVSALGSSPKSIGTVPDEIRPFRVLDPMLWLLNRAHIID